MKVGNDDLANRSRSDGLVLFPTPVNKSSKSVSEFVFVTKIKGTY